MSPKNWIGSSSYLDGFVVQQRVDRQRAALVVILVHLLTELCSAHQETITDCTMLALQRVI